jgi:uncharacterized protein YbjT (DUF2867 family)
MKVLVFGATGGTGRRLVQQALAQGHVVTAFAREPGKIQPAQDKLRVVRGTFYSRTPWKRLWQDRTRSCPRSAFVCQLGP